MALTDKLSAIGVAIREKTGKSELLTLDAMPGEIASITTGGGSEDCNGFHIPEDVFVIDEYSNCQMRFAYNNWNWFVEEYGDKIVFGSNVYTLSNLFNGCYDLKTMPVVIDLAYQGSNKLSLNGVFGGCNLIEEIPEIKLNPNAYVGDAKQLFYGCSRVREIPNVINFKIQDGTAAISGMFQSCYSIREMPAWAKKLYTADCCSVSNTTALSTYNNLYYTMFQMCYALDEVTDLEIYPGIINSNAFSNSFGYCSRLKKLTFQTDENGNPLTANWKGQTIDLSTYVGYASNANNITGFNAGVTTADRVYNETEYETNKNNPNYWTISAVFSRYNHDSAVETINSLPDTSAYLAANGGTNTIQFKGSSGSSTDGGAINTLTSEEIAVATAKGWTVTMK